MSFFGEIYADPDLPHRARTVYMYLRDRAGGGSCWPGVKTIARDLHLSPRTVQRAMNDLERAGYIQRQRRHRENGSCTSNLYIINEVKCKRQTTPRMDRHETIVTGRCETFRYCHIGGKGMTSAELKHRVKLQEWAARIQDCRSSGLSVRAWCRQEEINAATYYRWERELLALAETEPCSSVSAVRFAELPAPKRVPRNVAERSATLHIGNASLDIYPGCDTEQLKMLVELLRLC